MNLRSHPTIVHTSRFYSCLFRTCNRPRNERRRREAILHNRHELSRMHVCEGLVVSVSSHIRCWSWDGSLTVPLLAARASREARLRRPCSFRIYQLFKAIHTSVWPYVAVLRFGNPSSDCELLCLIETCSPGRTQTRIGLESRYDTKTNGATGSGKLIADPHPA